MASPCMRCATRARWWRRCCASTRPPGGSCAAPRRTSSSGASPFEAAAWWCSPPTCCTATPPSGRSPSASTRSPSFPSARRAATATPGCPSGAASGCASATTTRCCSSPRCSPRSCPVSRPGSCPATPSSPWPPTPTAPASVCGPPSIPRPPGREPFLPKSPLDMSDISQRLASLPPEKRDLLLKQLRARQRAAPQAPTAPALAPQPRGDAPPPLSFAQRRLWFLEQLEPGTSLYNLPSALRLEGPLDIGALERAFTELVHRHESLRTTFQAHEDTAVQVIAPPAPVTLTRVDLGALPAAEREAEAQRRFEAEGLRPFELTTGPLLRTTLVRLSDTEHVLVLVMHHIISDGWSMNVLVGEMAALYGAFSQGKPSPLPALSVQYADYTLWQRQWLRGEELERQPSRGTGRLQGMPGLLALPVDRPRPPMRTFRGASVAFQLPRALSESLQALCQAEGVTPYMFLLAAWQLLLHSVSGQEDLAVGSPIAGRRFAETEGLIGFFVNTLVLRSRLSPALTFRELLAQVRTTVLEAQAHQDLPFETLVEHLQPERDLSHGPLFQVWFVLDQPQPRAVAVQGLTLRPLAAESHLAKFDLALSMVQLPEGLAGSLEYNTDLFDAATITRRVDQFQVLLEGVCARPAARGVDVPLLTEHEARALAARGAPVSRELPRPALAHVLFEAQVRRTPDAVALRFGDETLTYGALNARANQLARHLRRLGVGPEVLVGVCLERSPELIVALLATAKAGGAWLPLDPSLPAERLDLIPSA